MIRQSQREKTDTEVPMTPLIDCVFLLIIFFMVTSMIKRLERQIPVTLSDPTAATEQTIRKDVYEVGIDTQRAFYAQHGQKGKGTVRFVPVPAIAPFLNDLRATRGTELPVQVSVDRETDFQSVIPVQDELELAGFRTILFRAIAAISSLLPLSADLH